MLKEKIINPIEAGNFAFQVFGNNKITASVVDNGNTVLLTREAEMPKKKLSITLEEAFGLCPGLADGFERDESDRF